MKDWLHILMRKWKYCFQEDKAMKLIFQTCIHTRLVSINPVRERYQSQHLGYIQGPNLPVGRNIWRWIKSEIWSWSFNHRLDLFNSFLVTWQIYPLGIVFLALLFYSSHKELVTQSDGIDYVWNGRFKTRH